MKRRPNPAEPKKSCGSFLCPELSLSSCVWEGQPGTPELCADREWSPQGWLEEKLLLGVFGTSRPSWVGVRAQQDILEEIPHVLLGSSWEEGFVGWWAGLVHSFHKHLWRPLCWALCAHGV